jgi:hypothetical protein
MRCLQLDRDCERTTANSEVMIYSATLIIMPSSARGSDTVAGRQVGGGSAACTVIQHCGDLTR